MMAIVVKGDALNRDDVERAIESIDGVDAVVSTLGGTTADPQVDSQVGSGGQLAIHLFFAPMPA